jgi:hypothetical protein
MKVNQDGTKIAVNRFWFAKPYLGGLGLGDAIVTFVLTILIIGFVGYLTVTRKGMAKENKR